MGNHCPYGVAWRTWPAMAVQWGDLLPPGHQNCGQCLIYQNALYQQQMSQPGHMTYVPICVATDESQDMVLEMATAGTLQVVRPPGGHPVAVNLPLPQPAQHPQLPVAAQPVTFAPGGAALPPPSVPQPALPRATHDHQAPLQAEGQNPTLPPVPKLGIGQPYPGPTNTGSVYNIPMPNIVKPVPQEVHLSISEQCTHVHVV